MIATVSSHLPAAALAVFVAEMAGCLGLLLLIARFRTRNWFLWGGLALVCVGTLGNVYFTELVGDYDLHRTSTDEMSRMFAIFSNVLGARSLWEGLMGKPAVAPENPPAST